MEKFQNALISIGEAAQKNKYLSAIKNAFEQFMPWMIAGAIAVL